MKKQAELGLNPSTRGKCSLVFLDEMALVVPWRERVALIALASPVAATERPLFEHETMPRIQFLQQWFGLSNVVINGALFESPLCRGFAGRSSAKRIPDRLSVLRFRHLLEVHLLGLQILATVNSTLAAKCILLKRATAIDASLIAAHISTKNSSGELSPEMQASALWHCEESTVFADAGNQGMAKRAKTQGIKMWLGKTDRSTPVALKSIETGAVVLCCDTHALTGFR